MANIAMRAARRAAADYFAGIGRLRDARMVLAGNADDYAEVQVALQAVAAMTQRIDRFERALACYADRTFWEGDVPEASLAFHDGGEIARAALAGKDLHAMHRD